MRALAFGEALIDCFPDRRVVAGAPLNVAVHLAALGWTTSLVTRLGADGDGASIRALLDERGVDLSLVETDPALPTGTVTIEFSGADHSFTIHGPVAWDAIEGPAQVPEHDLLVYGSLAGRAAASRAALRRILAAPSEALRVFDVNLRPPDVDAAVLRLGFAAARLVKVNEDELEEVGRLLGFEGGTGDWFAASPGLLHLCVTRGAAGAELHARGGARWTIGGAGGPVVDTVGAGDAFTAGLSDALARGRDGPEALARARDRAALVLRRRGGLP